MEDVTKGKLSGEKEQQLETHRSGFLLILRIFY